MTNLWRDEHGATAVEYALMVAAISAAIVLIVFAVGLKVNGAFTDMDVKLTAAMP